ncbi:MAG: M15 family metallopeptidase [Polyangiaceae bacterium]
MAATPEYRLPALALVASALSIAGCVEGAGSDSTPDSVEEVARARSSITVGEAADSSCSTSSVRALSLQIIEQAACAQPAAFVEVPVLPNVSWSDTVFPYLEAPARDAFVAAAGDLPSQHLTVNSMLRTVAQQLLLYRWYQEGRCGIGLAATPGNSNHETGLAFDVAEHATWQSTLEAHGFSWLGASDPVHFDYTGAGATDYRGADVLAFQVLWNKNHPEDPITEDGDYGPQTEARLLAAPVDGFPIGPSCAEPSGALTLSITGVDGAQDRFSDLASAGIPDAIEGDELIVHVLVQNTGDAALGGVLALSITGEQLTLSSAESRQISPIEPGASVVFDIGVTAESYSVDEVESPSLVATLDGDPDSAVEQPIDVYSRTHWEWDSARLEGATSDGVLTISAGSLSFADAPAQSVIQLPRIDLPAGPRYLTLRGARTAGSGDAALVIERPGLATAEVLPLDWPVSAEPSLVEIDLGADEITSLAIRPFDGAPGEATIEYVRVEDGELDSGPIAVDEDGCSCRAAGDERFDPAGAIAMALLGIGVGLRRRTNRRPIN